MSLFKNTESMRRSTNFPSIRILKRNMRSCEMGRKRWPGSGYPLQQLLLVVVSLDTSSDMWMRPFGDIRQ